MFALLLLLSLLNLASFIWLLVVAGRKSVLWLLGCLFIPCASLVFAIMHWSDARKPFLLHVLSAVLCFPVMLALSDTALNLPGRNVVALDEPSMESGEGSGVGEASAEEAEPVEEEAFPEAPVELRPLHWRVVSQDSKAILLQQASAPETCKVTCTLQGQAAPLWSADTCLGTRNDPRFISNDCERTIVLTALPAKLASIRDVPVVHIHARAQRAHTYKIGELIRDPDELRFYSSVFHWLKGVAGNPGSPPRYREDDQGVEFATIDGMNHSLPFYPNQTFIEVIEPGAEPRTRVQYRPEVPKGLLTVDLDVAATIERSGAPKELQRPPPLRFTLELVPGKAEEGAPLPVAYKVKAVKPINADDVEALTPQQERDLKLLTKARGQFQLAPNGMITEEEEPTVDLSSDGSLLLPQLHAALAQSFAVFPTEPVGPGARWRIRSYGRGRFRFSSRTCSLTALEGDKGTLICQETGEAHSVPMRMPGLVPNASLWVKRQTLTGELTQSFDVTQPVTQSKLKLQLLASVLASGKGRPTAFETQILTNAGVDVLPAKAKSPPRAQRR